METTIRPAHVDDAPELARMRAQMWEEMNPEGRARPEYYAKLADYWRRMLADELAVGWVAESGNAIIATAMLLLHEHPGRPTTESLVRGYVTSVYVVPEARRNGLGRRLMDTLIAWARERGMQRLELRSSTMARALYEQVGFEPTEFLTLRLE